MPCCAACRCMHDDYMVPGGRRRLLYSACSSCWSLLHQKDSAPCGPTSEVRR
ncbi:unnamed protein product [Periconia digitata]|uniref:Uncharacterized protein n=1 Tax=Periconia digitata TaxID=1303443 RepID=A0A9W4UMF0_9PLEO|nr:unnamed protein product [Periconia digitata]